MARKTTHTVTMIDSGHYNGMDYDNEYEVTFTYTPGSPDYWNRAIGCWEPGDSPSIEFVSISPDAGDHGAFTDIAQNTIVEKAKEWLDNDGYSEAIRVAHEDRK